MKYAFILGRVWKLSLAELLAYFKKENIKWAFIDLTKKALIVEADIIPEKVISELGGTIKIAEITKEFDFDDVAKQDFGEDVLDFISFYGSFQLVKNIRKIFQKIPKEGFLMPKELLRKGKLMKENCMVFGLKTTYYGPTIAVADPYFFIHQDEQKPYKEEEFLISRAMILVNLTQEKDNILDPHANLGTVGQAAAILGIKNMYLRDDDKKNIPKIRANITHFQKKIKSRTNFRIERTIDGMFNAIATVLPAGPKTERKIPRRDVQRIFRYLERENIKFFAEAKSYLKKDGLLVAVFPVFNSKEGKVFTDKFFKGYYMVDPFVEIPEDIKEIYKLSRKMLVDEEPERRYVKLDEYCIYRLKE
jgi:tRNA G10  N-methylase Trm11